MVQAYAGIGELDKAAGAQEIIAEDRNSAGAYATLAQIAYQAGQTRKGDLARAKALELTEPDMREALKGQLDQAKQASLQQSLQDATQNAPQSSATPTPSPNRSDRALQSLAHALVAQLAEQRTLNPKVPGSIPGGGTFRSRRTRRPASRGVCRCGLRALGAAPTPQWLRRRKRRR